MSKSSPERVFEDFYASLNFGENLQYPFLNAWISNFFILISTCFAMFCAIFLILLVIFCCKPRTKPVVIYVDTRQYSTPQRRKTAVEILSKQM